MQSRKEFENERFAMYFFTFGCLVGAEIKAEKDIKQRRQEICRFKRHSQNMKS